MKRLWTNLNPIGVTLGIAMLVLSLTPSLLPRPAVLQGAASGLTFGIGYAIGLGLSDLLGRLIRWRPSPGLRRGLRRIGWPVVLVILPLAAIGGIAAQNGVRRAVEMAPLDSVNVLGFVIALLGTSLACLGLGHLIRTRWEARLARSIEAGRSPARAHRQATLRTLIAAGVVLLVLATIAWFALDRIFWAMNAHPSAGVLEPDSTYHSAGPGSEVNFDELGRTGADFIAEGPTAEQISALTGRPALTPIRVYVGVSAGGTLAERAQIAVRELERTGAFEREVLVVANTTGSGWLEPQAVDSVEYLHSGNTAIAALQYAHTPSFVSALTAPNLTVDASTALFSAVRAKWLTLPADHRPQLVVYGLSLGAQGIMNSFGSVDALRSQTQGALLVGPTNATPLWEQLQASRDAGSPAWQPVLDQGEAVRWASGRGDFDRLGGPWTTPRVAILQHSTDPVTWLGPSVIWQRPEWLTEGNRAPDISPQMRWIPVVTAVQVLFDMFVAVDVPARHGHAFGDVMLDGWIAVTGDGGQDDQALEAIRELIESYSVITPVLN